MILPSNRFRAACGLTALLTIFIAQTSWADDVADEADLQFQIATERYRTNDFRGALEHFLVSNRLVPNRNVVFNIARTYEQLGQFPDAYRYYSQALDGETDLPTRQRIENALAHISPNVAVLRVQTDPPGASVYLDRKDLGSRGVTPRTLGLPPGRYKILVDLPGYEPAESQSLSISAGTQTPISLPLKPILGSVQLQGPLAGGAVRVDREDAPPLGPLPGPISIPPGRHVLYVSKEGYQTAEVSVDVPVNGSITIRPRLNPLTGAVVVNADERDALIEIDGSPAGFSPALLNIPVGTHRVRVSSSGFRPFEQIITVASNAQTRLNVELNPLDEVSAASRTTESVDDAPGSVTIIPSQELRAMGYPTIAEAIRGVRGLYLSDDRSYTTVGFRGFSRSGDYGNKVLILLDGHPTNDDILWQSFPGFEGRTDLEDIERIEVVRGPGSVLYGTGAVLGVINLVSRNRNAPTHAEVGLSAVDYGVGRARAMGQVKLGSDAALWTSIAGGHAGGRDFFFPEYVASTPPEVAGNARDRDGFDVGTLNGRFWYKAFTVQWFLTSRKKTLPTAEYDTILNDPRAHFTDTRGFVEMRFEPQVSESVQVLTRAYANLYHFGAGQPYTRDNGGLATEQYNGNWAGLEQRFIVTPSKMLRITVGGEVQDHFKVTQYGFDEQHVYLDSSNPYFVGAGYVVGDISPSRLLKISAGSRLDYFSTFGTSINPRLAFVIHPYEKGNLKILAGKAFRAPSVYELYYQNTVQRQSLKLDPETVYSGEAEFSHHFSTMLTATAAAYSNYVNNLVVSRGAGTEMSPFYYENSNSPVLTLGGEVEVRRDWRAGWMLAASYSYQHSRYVHDAEGRRNVPNSPEHLGSIKAAVPILAHALSAMTRVSIEGTRYNRLEFPTDPAQAKTNAAAIWDVVLTGESERYPVRYSFGIYNAFDWRYTAPVSGEFRQLTIPQNGRTLLLSTTVTF